MKMEFEYSARQNGDRFLFFPGMGLFMQEKLRAEIRQEKGIPEFPEAPEYPGIRESTVIP